MVAFKKKKSTPTKFTKKNIKHTKHTKHTKKITRTRIILGELSASLVFLVVNIYLFECETV